MKQDVLIFWIVIIANTVLTLLYWLFFRVYRKKTEGGFTTRCIVMLLCPFIGPAYFFLGWLWKKLFFHKPVDLVDVIFSKEREKILLKANEEGERDILPIEDAVVLSDTQSARKIMLEVLLHDVRKSLGSISLALNSEDSELSHYAASVLQSNLGKFRTSVQGIVENIDEVEEELRAAEENDGDIKTERGVEFLAELSLRGAGKAETAPNEDDDLEEGVTREKSDLVYADISSKLEQSRDYARHTDAAYEQGLRAFYGELEEEGPDLGAKLADMSNVAHKLIEEIWCVLEQKVLSEMESIQYTELMERIGLLIMKRDLLECGEMGNIAVAWMEIARYDRCLFWCDRLRLYYPEALETYSCRLKLYYTTGERDGFFETMKEMRNAGIVLDHEMMELVRVFM